MKPVRRVSVVVTAHNEAGAIAQCLRSIGKARAEAGLETECILVDDRSTDGTAERARACGEAVHVLRIGQGAPSGLTARQAALDIAFRCAAGDVIVVTDADAVVEPRWIRRLVDRLEAQQADAVAGLVRFRNGGNAEIAALQTVDAAWYHAWCRGLHAAGLASGAVFGSMCFRTGVYAKVGGFDRIGPSLTEDLAFARAIHAAGLRFAFDADPMVSVVGAPDWTWLRARLGRLACGGVSWLSVSLGVWEGLLLLPSVAWSFGVPGSGVVAAARYLAGAAAVFASLARAGLGRSAWWAFLYEPVAIGIGAAVAFDRLRGRKVEWGGNRYDVSGQVSSRRVGQ